MTDVHPAATIPAVEHHRSLLNGGELHYVTAGESGSPVLLVHGFPESWWVFHKLIPLLAGSHRVVAVDLRGFGDSTVAGPGYDSAASARDLVQLIDHLGLGPVHLTGQDISGPTTFRLAAERPDLVTSLTEIEAGLPGFGLEALADVTGGGAWHIGALAAPGIPEMLLEGRSHAFLTGYAIPTLSATAGAFSDRDVDELARTFDRPGGFSGAAGLYRSMLTDAGAFRRLAEPKLTTPVLAVGGGSGSFTADTMRHVATDVSETVIDDIGHYAAMEAPERLAGTLLDFFARTV